MAEIGRNDPCPCGSGKKYKRCCLRAKQVQRAAPSVEDRELTIHTLMKVTFEDLADEEDLALGEFFREIPAEWELDPYQSDVMTEVFRAWFWYDRPLSDSGERPVEILLNRHTPPGVRRYIEQMLRSALQPWQVTDVIPGRNITLRQVIDGSEVVVNERTASKTLTRGMYIAARIIELGPSGGPELDGGLMALPRDVAQSTFEQLRAHFESNRGMKAVSLYARAVPFFAHAWLASWHDPPLPDMANADGEMILPTKVSFGHDDLERIESILSGEDQFEANDDGSWAWLAPRSDGSLGFAGDVQVGSETLLLSTLTAEAAERGRALLEELFGESIVHRGTVHESIHRRIERGEEGRAEPAALDPAISRALVLHMQEEHYRGWVDEPVPALGGKTPRQAAARSSTRADVEEQIRGLEAMYEQALRRGAPAYDPSWMWAELGLVNDRDDAAPLLATDRWAQLYEWDDELAAFAAAIRSRPGFDDRNTLVTSAELRSNLDARRLLREVEADDELTERALVVAVNHELHRRRTFWVSKTLAFMLQNTSTDVVGPDLRLPFPSFALAFTDRATLASAEELLAAENGPMSGQILRVVTAYVRGGTGEADEERTITIDFAFDTFGDSPPQIVSEELVVSPDSSVLPDEPEPVEVELGGAGTRIDMRSARDRLLQTTLNAILYATSAGVEPVPRPAARTARGGSGDRPESDEIFYLPGKISISHVRSLSKIERGRGGGELMHRFMVRGHWRRANPSWKDQRMRWIEPYWKGPDLATIIERQYSLGPD